MAPSFQAQSDVELMSAVAAQDPQAQREVVRRVGGSVRRLTGLLCSSTADADDAAQQSLIAILKSAGSFRVATSLERWSERIAIRTTLRSARRERERRGLLERWLAPYQQPWGGSTSPGSEPVGLDALLEQLSPERRRAFVLRHALEYSVEEIAELSGAPVGTVKDRLVYARRQLRNLIERDVRRASKRRGPR